MGAAQSSLVGEAPRLRRPSPGIRPPQHQTGVRAGVGRQSLDVEHQDVVGSLLVGMGRRAAALVLQLARRRHPPQLRPLTGAFPGQDHLVLIDNVQDEFLAFDVQRVEIMVAE